MNKIEFSANWNGKLFLDNFGTIRLHNPDRYHVDAFFEIYLKGMYLGVAKVVSVKSFLFEKIGDGLAYIDCGKNANYLKKILSSFYSPVTNTTRFNHVVFHYTDRNIEAFESLLKEWWQTKIDQQPFINKQTKLFNHVEP